MKYENLLWIVMSLVMLSLAGKVGFDSTQYDCDKCEVKLYNRLPITEEFYVFGTYNIEELFLGFYHDRYCRITWDVNQGHMDNGAP